ncbi:armadillo-type protein [Blyttiomyces helicus]|uniref:Armadillo-type protein n=1 Tax=Blyttiomyces helicus TaxID=388810 RepID=A0A4V1IRZ8_9FUNG|nr:armadillo-type protein [Blyttiomyces helicus]|eukprot:RKO91807.1 armadillo-type protein [Blyttiomyces helicus]
MSADLRPSDLSNLIGLVDLSTFKNLDGSIKKNTSFIKKLKTNLTSEYLPALSKELLSLKLEKYLSEIVAALSEARLKTSSDIWAAVEISSLLHQRFADLSTPLVSAIVKQLGPPPTPASLNALTPETREKDEATRLGKQRIALRLLGELVVVGIVKPVSNGKEALIVTVLKELFATDKEHLNLPLAVAFVKFLGEYFLGKSLKKSRDRSGSISSTSGKPAVDSPLVTKEVQDSVRAILLEYFTAVQRRLVRDQKRVRQIDNSNNEHFIARGEINEERQERYEKALKSYEKLLESTQVLADYLDQEMPDLPEDTEATKIGIGVLEGSKDVAEKDPNSGPWEDDDAKAFYEHIIDLRNLVPAIFLGEKKEKEEEPAADDSELDKIRPISPLKDSTEDLEADADGAAPAALSSHIALQNLLTRLPSALNRDTVDQIAVEFAFLNSKGARKKLARVLLSVDRRRLDLLPYYARLIATLNPYMPDLGAAILETSFHGHQKRKEQVFIEDKIKNIRFIGELTKFKVTPNHVVYHCLKVLLENFKFHNVELACSLLESCGRFLYKSPSTHARTANYLDFLMRNKNIKHIDNRQALMIDNTYYQCNPPDRPAISVKERPPLESYMRKLIYTDLSRKSLDKVLKQLRKIDWESSATRRVLAKLFSKIWKVKFSHLELMAYLVAELARYHPDFGITVVDNALEEVRIGLELNIFKWNQRRIATVKFLGELYNYRMVESGVIFDTLYLLVNFGHEGNMPRPLVSSPIDAAHDFFRVRLCCTLLDTCGHYIDRGSQALRMEEFLVYFQMYIYTKVRPPMDIEFVISETFELLRPNMAVLSCYEEAVEEVNRLVMQRAGSNGAAGASALGASGGNAAGSDEEDDDDGGDSDDEEGGDGARGGGSGENDDPVDAEVEGVMLVDADDDAVVVHMDESYDAEADEDFEREFARTMAESLESRKFERKPAVFDVPIPSLKGVKGSDAPERDLEDGVAFTLLTKKGNKQQAKVMALPADSTFVLSTRIKQEAEQEEKLQLKQLVLNYELNYEERERLEGGYYGSGN